MTNRRGPARPLQQQVLAIAGMSRPSSRVIRYYLTW